MPKMLLLEKAECLEAGAVAYEQDATRYVGWRQEWRLKKAQELRARAEDTVDHIMYRLAETFGVTD